jgi:hypothetical protein
MFVRWNRRRRKSYWHWSSPERDHAARRRIIIPRFLLSAVLVRCERRGGAPRQKIVAYLGSIREDKTEDLFARRRFWYCATSRLDGLGLEPAEREKVQAALSSRVAPLTTGEEQEVQRQYAALLLLVRGSP